MEAKTPLPVDANEEPIVAGDPALDLPPYTGEGEDLAAKWYGAWKGLLPDLSLEDFRRMRDEWSREAEHELDKFEREHCDAHAPRRNQ